MAKKNDKKILEKKISSKVAKGPMLNYPVGDFLIRIKNAALSGKSEVVAKDTKIITAVSAVLKKEGYLDDVKRSQGIITVTLKKYAKSPVLLGLSLVSRPGLRQYVGFSELSKKRGPEIYILSTPKGVMSSKEALKKVVGGEVIAKVW